MPTYPQNLILILPFTSDTEYFSFSQARNPIGIANIVLVWRIRKSLLVSVMSVHLCKVVCLDCKLYLTVWYLRCEIGLVGFVLCSVSITHPDGRSHRQIYLSILHIHLEWRRIHSTPEAAITAIGLRRRHTAVMRYIGMFVTVNMTGEQTNPGLELSVQCDM